MILKKVSFQSLAECGQRFSRRYFSRSIIPDFWADDRESSVGNS